MGLLRGVAEQAPLLVAVDHHRSYDGFGQIALVDALGIVLPPFAIIRHLRDAVQVIHELMN